MLKNKKVFVSGGAGVIGNELVRQLQDQGAIIFVGDLKPKPPDWSNILYRQGDLNYITPGEISLFEPEIFIHLAATFERSAETYEHWEENFHHNIRLSNYLMTLMKDQKSLKRVVYASSYLIYNSSLYSFNSPQKVGVNLNENMEIKPRNLTGVAKLLHEIELQFLENFKSDQFTSAFARIFRGYGKGSRDVISRWVRDLIHEKKIDVYRGEGIFDYIFAADSATGLIKLADKYDLAGAYNLGTGNARKVNDIVQILKKYFPDMKYENIESSIPYEASQADMTKFLNDLNWKPQIQLEDSIPQIIEYEKQKLKENPVNPGNVLISSVSKKIPLVSAVKKAAEKMSPDIKIFGGDSSSDVIGKYFVDEFWQMPGMKDLPAKEIISFCKKNEISVIIPTRDGELEFFAENKNTFAKENITVMISDKESVKMCIDKLKFYESCKQKEISAILTSENIEIINSDRFVVKEKFGAGSRSLGLNLTKAEAVKHSKSLEHPVFQPFIKGEEFSTDAYISKTGITKGMIIRKRELVVGGESQITSNVNNKIVETLASKFLQTFKFYGHIILQILVDEKKSPYLIECNCRFGGASTFSISCGLDSFYWLLLEANNQDISTYPFIYNPDKKFRQIRFPQDKFIKA